MNDLEIFRKLAELQEQRIPVCLATIVKAAGSTPRKVGAKMIICADGTTFGSVGGGCGESRVRTAAFHAILRTKEPTLLEVDLTDDLGVKGGDVCGGKMWLFVAPFNRE
jgi:xanthine/CO dehydrogenase XdhC/CoxF family maturation factor